VKVLIADDEPMHAFLLEMFLKKWGYTVTIADNGESAKNLLVAETAPCVAILDWKMPGLTGVEVCRALKRQPEKSNIFVLLLTAQTQVVDRQRAVEAGVDGYMTKPYEPEELRGQLRSACALLESKSY
jgi:two-component system phosphate regulon response regulator PhoB